MKKRDLIIIAVLLLLALGLYAVSQLTLSGEASVVVVTVDGQETLRRPLVMESEYEIRQEDGSLNVLTIKDGAVWMSQANCRDGLCLRMGKMKNGAKTIVCLPHKVVVRIEGEAIAQEHNDLDVIIQ